MNPLYWLIAAIILVGAEALAGELFLLMLAGGALAASGGAALGAPLWGQLVIFAGTSCVLLFAVRPVARRHLLQRARLLNTPEALEGRRAQVVQWDEQGQQIRLDHEIWSAHSESDAQTLSPGDEVIVVRIDGPIALVTRP